MISSRRLTVHLVGTFLLLGTTAVASRLMTYRRTDALVQPLSAIDRSMAGFTGTENPPLDPHTIETLKPTSYLSRRYKKAGTFADLFIAYYAEQRAGESMHSPKHCLPGAGWEILEYKTAQIPVDGHLYDVNQYTVSHESDRMLILYWYQSKGRIIASEYMGKLLLARDTLLQHTTSGSIVRLTIPDRPGALDSVRSLAAETIRQVSRSFGG